MRLQPLAPRRGGKTSLPSLPVLLHSDFLHLFLLLILLFSISLFYLRFSPVGLCFANGKKQPNPEKTCVVHREPCAC